MKLTFPSRMVLTPSIAKDFLLESFSFAEKVEEKFRDNARPKQFETTDKHQFEDGQRNL